VKGGRDGRISIQLRDVCAGQANLTAVAPYMFWLMLRNVASDGLMFTDPVNPGVLPQPGAATSDSAPHLPRWHRPARNRLTLGSREQASYARITPPENC
jgi:hypothetical protein